MISPPLEGDTIRLVSDRLSFHGYETLSMACLTGCVIQFEQISEPAQCIEVCPKFLRKEIAISAPDPALKFFAISDNEFKRLSKRTVNQPLRAYSRPDPTDVDAMAVWNSTKRPIVARRTAEHLFKWGETVFPICETDIDIELRRPHPGACEIDHVIPTSKGGDDT